MIVPMREILKDAVARKYAAGCFNAVNLEMVRGVIRAAEETKSPAILCHAEVHCPITPIECIAPIMVSEASRAKVPVALLLDHGVTFSALIKAMHLGFNAVMFDGSKLTYEENIQRSAEIVKIAHELNVDVEAELGCVTRPKSAGAMGSDDDSAAYDSSLLTDPGKVGDFVQKTGVDALAVAVGTAHGLYTSKPKLDFDRLSRIKNISPVPLVLHGGSGLTEEQFAQCIAHGVSKINYYTAMALKSGEDIGKLYAGGKKVFFHEILGPAIQSICDDVIGAIRVFGSAGKA